ncbi:sodium:solute symporter family protein [Prauserella alba]|uniref:sodium:solute symporter family protein n=1 Tax=Prauserella alba TaxID=176898 RepID=UPI0020A2941F|nr:sodium:solute symporter family protein [Prauserella alba]MCP2183016.1 solute:Na+ symporter, SSS family [Prauserella alba]
MNWYLVWIVGFLILLFAVSVKSAKTVKTAADYAMADFKLGFFPICGSIIATVTGSAALIGGAGKGFEMGISYLVTASYVLFTVVGMLVLGPVIRKLRLYTVPELFARRFGKLAALIPALIIGFLYMTPTFGMQLVGMSSILSSITDLSFLWGIVLGFTVVVAFTLIGGMPSVAWTDAIQTVVILGGVVLTLVVGVAHVGGPGVVAAATPERLLSFGSIGFTELLNWFLIFGPFYLVWQTTWQRITAARSTKVGISAVTIGFVISGLVGLLAIFIGIAAVQMFPAGTDPDVVYTSFITQIFPGSIGGLLMVSLLAALLTGATSFLLSGAINISKDIYEGWINPKAGDAQILKISRLSVAFMAVLGLVIALWVTDIIVIYQIALSFTASALVAPALAAMFWERATKAGVITSTIGALVASLAWRLAGTPFGIHEIAPGLAVSAVLLVAVSLATRHSDDETVTAYFHAFRRGRITDSEAPDTDTAPTPSAPIDAGRTTDDALPR